MERGFFRGVVGARNSEYRGDGIHIDNPFHSNTAARVHAAFQDEGHSRFVGVENIRFVPLQKRHGPGRYINYYGHTNTHSKFVQGGGADSIIASVKPFHKFQQRILSRRKKAVHRSGMRVRITHGKHETSSIVRHRRHSNIREGTPLPMSDIHDQLISKGINLEGFNGWITSPSSVKTTIVRTSGGTKERTVTWLEQIIKDQAKAQRISIRQLAQRIQIDERTIERIWTKPEARSSLSTVIAVCIGLHMQPTTSETVLQYAGYHLRDIPVERVYRMLIYRYYEQEIEICNQILLYLGFAPLSPAI